jgi:hypothetical protein
MEENMKFNESFWLASGIAIGMAVANFWHPSYAAAQNAQSGAWQLVIASAAIPTGWRINTLTGELEVCSLLGGPNCVPMPAPRG